MARRSRRPRRRTASGSYLSIPFVQEIIEGKTAVFSFNSIFGKESSTSVFKSLPWRVTSVYLEMARSSDINDPGIIQIRLNNAMSPNVEGISSRRMVITPGQVRKCTLSSRSPNPWKEEEQKAQNILEIDNIKFGTDSVPCKIGVYAIIKFQFAQFVFDGYDKMRDRAVQDSPSPSPLSDMSVLSH